MTLKFQAVKQNEIFISIKVKNESTKMCDFTVPFFQKNSLMPTADVLGILCVMCVR